MSSVPNYRQEIRGVLRENSGGNGNAQSLDQQQQQQQKALNRLSRVVNPHLHQQHLKNLWKHYCIE